MALLCAPSARAAFRMELEPLVGYERVQKVIPIPHTRNRLMYGGRLTVGIAWLAAELEYLNSTDKEDFPLNGITTKDVDDRAKVGARINLNLARFLAFTLRGGGQASRNRHTETSGGTVTTTQGAILYKPYAGTGLTASFGRTIALRADLVAIFANFPNLLGATYQATAGLVIRFP